jgi:hypothetical protein
MADLPERVPLPSRVTIAPEVIHQVVDDQVVLLDMAAQTYFSLDDVGSRIWGLLSESPEIDALCARMLATYAVEEEALRADIAAFVARLDDAGLVTVEP